MKNTFQNAAVECACFAKSNTKILLLDERKKIWSELLKQQVVSVCQEG